MIGDRVVTLLSGGLDSTVLLYHLAHRGYEVHALSVNYNQRHLRELESAIRTTERLVIDHRIVQLDSVAASLLQGSALTSPDVDVPMGHYEDESMKATVVPNRNMILLSLATAWAISLKATAVAYAAHAGDHAIYPDCRPEFVEAMTGAIKLADWHQVELWTPFLGLPKSHIAKVASEYRVPVEDTWSCYLGNSVHCSTCGTCMERRLAFREAEIKDPTVYALTEGEFDDWLSRAKA